MSVSGVRVMLDGALGRLFFDLDKIPKPMRSAYESALHRELLELSQRLRPLSSTESLTGAMLRRAIERSPGLMAEVDAGSSSWDVTRLHCNEPNCPNKRR
jgi:hypothetical protein